MVLKHASLVKKIAQHLKNRLPQSVQLDDLIQSGMLGLLEASKGYDESKGASFETYAGIRIRGSILDELRKSDWTPRSVHRNARKVAEIAKDIEGQTGIAAKHADIAERMGVTLDEYYKILKDSNNTCIIGFDDLSVEKDNFSEGLSSRIVEPLEGAQKDDIKHRIILDIKKLPEKEQLVLSLYYDEEMNLKEIGEVLGVSESRISQIHSQAVLKLRTKLKSWDNKKT